MTFEEDYRRQREFHVPEQGLVNTDPRLPITLRHLHFEIRKATIEVPIVYDSVARSAVSSGGYFTDPRRQLRMKIRVADRDNGLPLDIVFTDAVVIEAGQDPKDQVHWIKRAIMRAFEHELDECLYVAGVRDDPHERDGL